MNSSDEAAAVSAEGTLRPRRIGGPRTLVLLGAGLLLLALAACMPGANDRVEVVQSAGFWLGLWHGFIAPVTFVISRFASSVGMYEVHNNGGWYDFGFLLGLGMLHGGGAAGRGAYGARKRRNAR
jgi:hypothetical protein